MATEEEIVERAAEAATELVFSAYHPSAVADLDVRVSFEDEELSIDIYLDTEAETAEEREQERRIADDATVAAVDAVDRLLAED